MEKLLNDFKIEFTKGDTYALAVKFKNISEDLRLAYFTVKENADDEPLIQKSLGEGISKIDDREYKNEKTYKVQLQSEDTAKLEPLVQYLYDLRVTVDNVVKTVLSGVFVVSHSVAGVTGTTTQSLEVAVDDEVEVEAETTPATNGIEYEQDPIANAKIGDLANLKTTDKTTIVGAINEVRANQKNDQIELFDIMRGNKYVPKAENATTADNAKMATVVNGESGEWDISTVHDGTGAVAGNDLEFLEKDCLYIVDLKDVTVSNLEELSVTRHYSGLYWHRVEKKSGISAYVCLGNASIILRFQDDKVGFSELIGSDLGDRRWWTATFKKIGEIL